MLKTNFEQFRKVNKDFMPDICISDYDSFTHAFAKVAFAVSVLFPDLIFSPVNCVTACFDSKGVKTSTGVNFDRADRLVFVLCGIWKSD